MNREKFIQFANTLRDYSRWEKNFANCGLNLTFTPITEVLENYLCAMCNFEPDWAYDEKLGFDWIIDWAFNTDYITHQTRHGVEFDLTDAGALYDFLVFMNECGWEG